MIPIMFYGILQLIPLTLIDMNIDIKYDYWGDEDHMLYVGDDLIVEIENVVNNYLSVYGKLSNGRRSSEKYISFDLVFGETWTALGVTTSLFEGMIMGYLAAKGYDIL